MGEEEPPEAALRPAPEDEGRHEPGLEPLWNESWYFDAVSADGTLGAYHRIGRMPNVDGGGVCVLGACIVQPGGPTLMLGEGAAPLPPSADDSQLVETPAVRASYACEKALERFRIEVSGTAAAFADHSAPLRGERGEPAEIEIELTFETDGVPYM